MKFRVDYKSKNINNDTLYKDITALVSEAANDFIVQRSLVVNPEYDYREFAEFVRMYFSELIEDKIISQYDVICDKRNNSEADARKCAVNLTVTYVQSHCLNTSEIHAKIHL